MHTDTIDLSQTVHRHVPVWILAEGYSSNNHNQEIQATGKAHFEATL